jgi:hypothetical protein
MSSIAERREPCHSANRAAKEGLSGRWRKGKGSILCFPSARCWNKSRLPVRQAQHID